MWKRLFVVKRLFIVLMMAFCLGAVAAKADTVLVQRYWPDSGIWFYYKSADPANLIDVLIHVYCGFSCLEWDYASDSVPEAWVQDPVNHTRYTDRPEFYYQATYTWGENTTSGFARAIWDCEDVRSDLNQEYVDNYSGGSVYFLSGYLPNCDPWDGGWATGGGTANFSWSELNGGFQGGNPHSSWGIVRASLKNGLEATRANYNRGRIRLSSGFRCPHGNANEGGVRNSYHVHGRAADMFSADHPWTEDEFGLLRLAAENTGNFVELLFWNTYPSDHHLHAAW